jgi:hypothetical protein
MARGQRDRRPGAVRGQAEGRPSGGPGRLDAALLKLVKRQRYGRAKIDLLRNRPLRMT